MLMVMVMVMMMVLDGDSPGATEMGGHLPGVVDCVVLLVIEIHSPEVPGEMDSEVLKQL